MIVTIEVIDQFHTLLLPIYNDFIEVRGAYLLSLYDQIILGLVCEVDLDLIEVDLLVDVGIHLCNVLRVQVLNSTNVYIRDVQDVATGIVSLLLLSTTFVRV